VRPTLRPHGSPEALILRQRGNGARCEAFLFAPRSLKNDDEGWSCLHGLIVALYFIVSIFTRGVKIALNPANPAFPLHFIVRIPLHLTGSWPLLVKSTSPLILFNG